MILQGDQVPESHLSNLRRHRLVFIMWLPDTFILIICQINCLVALFSRPELAGGITAPLRLPSVSSLPGGSSCWGNGPGQVSGCKCDPGQFKQISHNWLGFTGIRQTDFPLHTKLLRWPHSGEKRALNYIFKTDMLKQRLQPRHH